MTYQKPDKLVGWDFSRLKLKIEGPQIEYIDIVKSHLNKESALLDIGTGGGERLAIFTPLVRKAVGIDISESMIETAKINVPAAELIVADAYKIPFPDNSFDVITNRHALFSASEVYRLLKMGGVFITQQVAENDKKNWKDVFGRGQDYGIPPGTKQRNYIQSLEKAGLTIVEQKNADTTEFYETMNDVLFLLANTPIITGFDFVKDEDKLKEIEAKFSTERGIVTNSARYLIIAVKS